MPDSLTTPEIPLVRAAFRDQFTRAMRRTQVDPERYYRLVNLPITPQEDPDSLLPEKPFWQLINLVATNEGIPDFGYRVARLTPWHTVESLYPILIDSESLGDLLTGFCDAASDQSSHVHFQHYSEKGLHWFSRTGEVLMKSDVQMELYRITCMIQLVQLAAGSGWYPPEATLLTHSIDTKKSCPILSRTRISPGRNESAIAFPSLLIDVPVNLDIPSYPARDSHYDIQADFEGTLMQLIRLYTASGECKIGTIAALFETSTRSLQRRMANRGISFSKLLNEARNEIARMKLVDGVSVSEVGRQLGYADTAHFSRAFKRLNGISPSAFRAASDSAKTH